MSYNQQGRYNNHLICGVGLNDADYVVYPTINGKRVPCHYFFTWRDMIRRCYSDKHQLRHPSYKGCSVVEEWHTFSNFKAWMETQDWKGKDLDKDLLIPGNKVYGPDTCMFVSHQVNTILNVKPSSKYKQGVACHKGVTSCNTKKYFARIRKYGKHHLLGSFYSEDEAHEAYLVERKKYIIEVADTQDDIVKNILYNYAKGLKNESKCAKLVLD